MNLQASPLGSMSRLLDVGEVSRLAHELGRALHMLCHGGTSLDYDDLPADLLNLPATLAETVAINPAVFEQYAQHNASGAKPGKELMTAFSQVQACALVQYLQSANVALGLHGEAFDPYAATAEDLEQASVALWQRYSLVTADP